MKLSNVAAIVAVAALSAAACAQRPGMGGPGGPGGMGGFRRMTPQQQADRQTDMMAQMLGLTAAQKAKVHALILKNALQIKKIRDGQEAQIKKLLTPDQVKKMGSMPGPGGFGGRPGGPGGPGMRRSGGPRA
jgi:Spy/CpxP family protein refolding chaperone